MKAQNRILGISAIMGLLILTGCEEGKVELSSGNKTDTHTLKQTESMDQASYAGLESVFLDTKTIASNGKPMLFIFGKNNCTYCDKLKDDIKANPELQNLLTNNFATYYINIDYTKIHHISFESDKKPIEIDTANLAREYGVRPTPTLIFLDSRGKAFFLYPGYITPAKLQALLHRTQELKTIDPSMVESLSNELSALIDSTISMQFVSDKLLSLAGSKSPLTPLRAHTRPESRALGCLDSVMSLVVLDSTISMQERKYLAAKLIESIS